MAIHIGNCLIPCWFHDGNSYNNNIKIYFVGLHLGSMDDID